MNKYIKLIQLNYKRLIMSTVIFSFFSLESLLGTAVVNQLTLRDNCISSWLVLSKALPSVFDIKMQIDDIDDQLYPELSKFVIKHRCPAGIEEIILHQLSLKDRLINHYQNSSYIIIKGQAFDRLVNAERMRKCIEMHNLNLLTVPLKYLYKDGDVWGVAVLQSDTSDSLINFSLQEVKQIFVLAMETGYRDWKFDCPLKDYRNFFYDKNGRIVCIDTEDLSFQVTGHCHEWPKYVPHDCKANYAMSILHYKECMQPEALTWVTQKVEEILQSPDAFKKCLSLPFNTKYDDPSINIAQVKQEFRQYREDIQAKKSYDNIDSYQPAFC